MDYYKVLNLKNDASFKEIEQAYLDLSSFYNPNTNVSKDAYKKYREINKAYNVLKEEKQRELYNLTLKEKDESLSKDDSLKHDFNEFVKGNREREDISKFNDVLVDDDLNDYLRIKIEIPYLYFLLNSEYLVSFAKKEIVKEYGVCKSCLGLGKVKENNKIVYCKSCLGSGKEIETKDVLISKYYLVNETVIDHGNKVIVEFISNDKEFYKVEGNTIYFKYKLSKHEYNSGVKLTLKNKENILNIEESTFDETHKTYFFLDNILKIEYVIEEDNKLKEGYIVSESSLIYINPSNFTYSEISSDTYTLKLELNDKEVRFNHSGIEYLLHVIKIKNEDDNKIFFDKKIKKVSASLFKFKGRYNNHYFKNKWFEYDNEYIYIPNRAYKLKSKYYTLFKILYLSLIFVMPLIFFLIFNISCVFFILSFISIVMYLIGVNLLMEVKL